MPTILPEGTHIQRKDGTIYPKMPMKRRQTLLVQSGESNRKSLQWQSSSGSKVDHRRSIGKLGFDYVLFDPSVVLESWCNVSQGHLGGVAKMDGWA